MCFHCWFAFVLIVSLESGYFKYNCALSLLDFVNVNMSSLQRESLEYM